MQLGRIKDQLETVMDKMATVDPTSQQFEILAKRRDELTKIISDEEQRRLKEEIDNDRQDREDAFKERELEERRKDRWVKIGLGTMAGAVALVGSYRDTFAVVVDKGIDTFAKIKKAIF